MREFGKDIFSRSIDAHGIHADAPLEGEQKQKGKHMKHDVTFTLPERDLGKADVEFRIKRDGSKHGTLKVSKGTIVWVPKDHTYGYKMGWSDFAGLMEKHGTKEG